MVRYIGLESVCARFISPNKSKNLFFPTFITQGLRFTLTLSGITSTSACVRSHRHNIMHVELHDVVCHHIGLRAQIRWFDLVSLSTILLCMQFSIKLILNLARSDDPKIASPSKWMTRN